MCTVCGVGISVCSAARSGATPAAATSAQARHVRRVQATTTGQGGEQRHDGSPREGKQWASAESVGRRRAPRATALCARYGAGLADHARRRRLPFHAGRGARRKDQRLDHHRHRAGRRQHGADVDVVELLELEAVDRDDRVVDLHLLAQVNAHQAADVAVAGQHQRMAVGEHRRPAPSTTPWQKASSRWKVAEPRHGTNTATGVSASPRSRRLSTALIAAATPRRVDLVAVEREGAARSPARCAAAARRAATRRWCCRSPAWCIATRRSRWRGCLRSSARASAPSLRRGARISCASSTPRSP